MKRFTSFIKYGLLFGFANLLSELLDIYIKKEPFTFSIFWKPILIGIVIVFTLSIWQGILKKK